MDTATATARTAVRHAAHFDPYKLDPRNVVEPPVGTGSILRRIGPGLVLSASIVGSGELIATTTLGARFGYTMMWLIIVSCVIKAVVQAVLGRYIIASGETTLIAFSRIPGPKALVNWVAWCWFAATVAVLFALTGMYIGVSQVMHGLFPTVPVTAWVLSFMVLTLVLLLGGAYPRIEKIAMIKVALFTLITCLSAVILMNMPQYFSWGDVLDGLHFRMPEGEGLAVAIAVFGITGVASGELCIYPYWCIEKGYARFTGPREDTDAWRRRARGWIRVMHTDVVVSMIIYTLATIAFYLLGAGVLHGMGQVPGGKEMISALSNIYTQTLGAWSLWLFYLGAVMILYGTVFAVTAGNSRMLADFCQLLGAFARDDYRRRTRFRDLFIFLITVLAVSLYFVFGQAPVTLVVWTGIGQAALLPIVAFGTLFLATRHLVPELKVPGWMMGLLWIAAVVITVFIVPSLYLEFVKMF
ncbi:MAG TPA: Nramp family divalent metal transporter [Burkholderiales bacterium]|jgi:manganese transport protein|nr:Nramp family divalent metal transporter [Burkholderiales bacterium]